MIQKYAPVHRLKYLQYLLIGILSLTACFEHKYRKAVAENLHLQIDALQSDSLLIAGEPLFQTDLITEIYRKGGEYLSPKWQKPENIRQLLDAIRGSAADGLQPEDYHLSAIEMLIDSIRADDLSSAAEMAQLEILLTDAFILLSSHLAAGKVDPLSINAQWHAARRALPYAWDAYLDSVLLNGQVAESFETLRPRHAQYQQLKMALRKYRQMAEDGGWTQFETQQKKLEKGMVLPEIAALRERLAITQGPFEPDTENPLLFDQSLHEQVVIFQTRNGLPNDGVIGPRSIQALNLSVADRIATIEANLERWRWVDEDLGEKHIMVNIANFSMKLIENDSVLFETEAIVGKTYRKTPVFSGSMNHVVFNPDWTVPPGILRNDVIPAVLKNRGYLAEKNMQLLGRDGKEIHPASVDWKQISPSNFPYMVRQRPGKDNALGKVKFMFPNTHNVYIHDTPTRNLFSQTDRAFSSGCIRINRPIDFAKMLLEADGSATAAQIDQILARPDTRTIRMKEHLPVHLLYLTAWADESGTAYFRSDVYDRDSALIVALKRRFNEEA
jgi:L,D-transpeptidase YcbB